MKKSNKLLLFTLLLPLVLLALANLSLLAKYKGGDYITSKQIHAEQYERKEFAPPVCLSVEGIKSINIFASDTFAIEFDKREEMRMYKIDQKGAEVLSGPPKPRFEQRGDTLAITGYDTLRIKNTSSGKLREVLNNFQSLNLYCRNIPTLLFDGSQIVIFQNKRPALGPSSLLVLKNGSLSLGDLSESNSDTTSYYYDSLHVKAIRSIVNLNPHTSIGGLRVELDSFSMFNDVSAKIGHVDIRFTDRTNLSLTGANLRKIPLKNP